MDASLSQSLLQRLLTRLDHIEFRVLRDQQQESSASRDELQSLRAAIDNMNRARQLEAQDSLLADAQALAPRAVPAQAPPSGSHRGPGALPAPAPAEAPVENPFAMPEQALSRVSGARPGEIQGDTVFPPVAEPQEGEGAQAPTVSPARS